MEARIKALLASAPLLLFMKGSKEAPYCGFSGRVVDALTKTGHGFDTFDIFQDEEIRWARVVFRKGAPTAACAVKVSRSEHGSCCWFSGRLFEACGLVIHNIPQCAGWHG